MKPGGSMPHSQRLSNNPYIQPNHPITRIDAYYFKIHSNIVLQSTPGIPKGLFPAGVPVTVLKALLPSFILAT